MKQNMKAYKDLEERIISVLRSLTTSQPVIESGAAEIMSILAEYDEAVQTTRDGIVRKFLLDNLSNGKTTSLLERLGNIRAFHKVDEHERKGD